MVCFKEDAARAAADEKERLISRLRDWNDADAVYQQLQEIDELDLVEAADVRFGLRQREPFSLIIFDALLAEWRAAVQQYPPCHNRDGEWIDPQPDEARATEARLKLLKWLGVPTQQRAVVFVPTPSTATVVETIRPTAAENVVLCVRREMTNGLTVAEAAKLLQCAETSVYRIVNSQKIPKGRFRGQTVFDASAIAAYVRQGRDETKLAHHKRIASPSPATVESLQPQRAKSQLLYKCSQCGDVSTDPSAKRCRCGGTLEFVSQRRGKIRASSARE